MVTNDMNFFLIFLSAMLVNNLVLIRFLSLCPFLGVSGKIETSIGMGMSVLFVMVNASSVTWLVYHFLLKPFQLEVLRTVAFILVIAALVQFTEMYMRKNFPPLYDALGIYLPLITTNCGILGVALLNIDYDLGFIRTIVFTIGSAMGFTLSIVLFASIRERIFLAPVPKVFAWGWPSADAGWRWRSIRASRRWRRSSPAAIAAPAATPAARGRQWPWSAGKPRSRSVWPGGRRPPTTWLRSWAWRPARCRKWWPRSSAGEGRGRAF
jgi:electron transport complex protein RnfA